MKVLLNLGDQICQASVLKIHSYLYLKLSYFGTSAKIKREEQTNGTSKK
jgi:hypothetical protein